LNFSLMCLCKLLVCGIWSLLVYWEFTDVSGKRTAFIFRVEEPPEDGGRNFSEIPVNLLTTTRRHPR